MRKCWEAVPVKGCLLFSLHLVQISHFLLQLKMGNLVHHRVYFFFLTRPIIHDIRVCQPSPWQIGLLLVVNVEVLQSEDLIPLAGALGARRKLRNKTVLERTSLFCSRCWKRSEPSLARMVIAFKESRYLKFKITCGMGTLIRRQFQCPTESREY